MFFIALYIINHDANKVTFSGNNMYTCSYSCKTIQNKESAHPHLLQANSYSSPTIKNHWFSSPVFSSISVFPALFLYCEGDFPNVFLKHLLK